ncbi:thiol-disulfide oxidoreductase DCC family protein [Pseudomonas sp. dw_358]|uniref:thiol-disulfide oxidoreductase DCC family protein n=1 Tax=Pseudomonas sp. dw_358 TaxID=2720083 RepID=UPI001BD440E5|nr:thiol-disulfide oxidoreductase DCC family protein [Pseudomonas sp. dw_358]
MAITPPPCLNPDDCVVLFDGVCKLCNGWASFLIRHDPAHAIRLASVQSPEGQALLQWAGLPQDEFDTIAVIDAGQLYVRSNAFLQVMRHLPAPWPWLAVLRAVPRPLRDWGYDRIALNRYRWFGRYDACQLPNADHGRRFIG